MLAVLLRLFLIGVLAWRVWAEAGPATALAIAALAVFAELAYQWARDVYELMLSTHAAARKAAEEAATLRKLW